MLPVETKVGEVEDLATLAKLDDRILLEELKERYMNDRIYTFVGDILVAINPFKKLPIYGKDAAARYTNRRRTENPPHIFAVADAAYQAMQGLRGAKPRSQCVLISGESGAGKTESTKLIIKQLVELCHGNTQIEQQILQVNPLLEAFGNAKTLMNDNSSRFGKYIQLKFKQGHVLGAKISEYLLEKSRVIRQNYGEENFHIFYYLFAGLSPEDQEKYRLGKCSSYKYLNDETACLNSQTSLQTLHAEYEELVTAMDMVGFTDEEQEGMYQVLSSVLNLGNINIDSNQDGEAVINKGDRHLSAASKVAGLVGSELHAILTCSVTFTRGDRIQRNYTREQALDARDAVAKTLYGRLFSWIVNKINTLLAPVEKNVADDQESIGILDIFGFETFQTNSFEQACINLANEQLQFFFNRHIFALEQEEYRKEGIDWKEIKFVDNQSLLDLFFGRPIGIMALLDEEGTFPKGSDQSLVDKLNLKFDDNEHFIKSLHSREPFFTIHHYAGKVKYDANGWLDKNRDTIPPGASEMLQNSNNQLIKSIFGGEISRTGTLIMHRKTTRRLRKSKKRAEVYAKVAKERKLTVGAQFRNSLQVLMEKMTSAQPVFIRCVKPNNSKKAMNFEDKYVQNQLLYTGMLETTKIRREGFAVRPVFAEFVEKYKIILKRLSLAPTSKSCHEILTASKLSGWHIGKTKVFLKYEHIDKLTDLLEQMGKKVVHIQRVARGFLARCRVARLQKEALRQKEETERLAREIEEANKVKADELKRAAELDKNITKDFFDKNKENKPTVSFDTITKNEQNNGIKKLESSESAQDSEDSESDDDDSFNDVKLRAQNKYGEVGTKMASMRWFQETQVQTVQDKDTGHFASWFHGIITRRESERLLADKSIGCFLIRVSESRFGYTLSFRSRDRVRHYMIDQLPNGKFMIIGERKVHRTLSAIIEYHQKNQLSNWDGLLHEPCGQEDGQCDYAELVGNEKIYNDVYDVESLQPDPIRPSSLSASVHANLSPKSSSSASATPPPPLPTRNNRTMSSAQQQPVNTVAHHTQVNEKSGSTLLPPVSKRDVGPAGSSLSRIFGRKH